MHQASVMDCWCRLNHTEKQLGECAESFREGAMNEYALAHALAFVSKLRLATFRLQLSWTCSYPPVTFTRRFPNDEATIL
jgi:hypothetical protein